MILSALFSDGMIIQRNKINHIWGYTLPNQALTGDFNSKPFEGQADKQGYFDLVLPKLPAGGPYKLTLTAEEQIVIQDILVGDVFLLGGQSNMELPLNRTLELYREELAATKEPEIRTFELLKEYDFREERQEVWNGSWKKAEGEDLYNFSAVGYFTAKILKERYGIPIGLIQSAVGGTPARSWCSEETIRKMGYYAEELERCKLPFYPKMIEETESRREQNWHQQGYASFSEKAVAIGKIEVPGIWNENELANFHGAVRLTKHVTLTEEDLKKPAELVLGAIIDADITYINGTYVGDTGYMYPPRFYSIPDGILKAGDNIIEICMFVFRGTGGFMPEKQYGIRFGEAREVSLDLAGEWDYEIMKSMDVLPDTTFFNCKASGLYNGMIAPLRKWNICSFLYYQGESDCDHPERYAKEMEALIGDWRKLWNDENLPFLYVQLTGFSNGVRENEATSWTEIRAAQEENLSVSQTAMVVTYDIGEFNDLHPMNKKTLGERMALAVRKRVYKEPILGSGPKVKDIEVVKDGVVWVTFVNSGSGLVGKDNQKIQEVELRDINGLYQQAQARIEGGKLVVVSTKIKHPTGIRYAWRDCPIDANLYNVEGLPAFPFCREWE